MQRTSKTRKLSGLAGFLLFNEGQRDSLKMKDAHIVPLITQTVALLRDIHPLTGNQRYVLASNQGKNGEKHISREFIGFVLC
ncbi:MAG: hypothetical protein EPN17_07840 [Methylobacter sp.]|nr:MAG: hypothetical protein EPN17_07840 [Methylobacter sp.]